MKYIKISNHYRSIAKFWKEWACKAQKKFSNYEIMFLFVYALIYITEKFKNWITSYEEAILICKLGYNLFLCNHFFIRANDSLFRYLIL
jgi:hypothetical protein